MAPQGLHGHFLLELASPNPECHILGVKSSIFLGRREGLYHVREQKEAGHLCHDENANELRKF